MENKNNQVLVNKFKLNIVKKGAIRELNPGPLVPKTRIIPLDQSPLVKYSYLIEI